MTSSVKVSTVLWERFYNMMEVKLEDFVIMEHSTQLKEYRISSNNRTLILLII